MSTLTPTWLPPQRHLHYQELYHGIYEWLRAPPCDFYQEQANEYVQQLILCYHPSNVLQHHRIQWANAWLGALRQEGYESDADTVVGD